MTVPVVLHHADIWTLTQPPHDHATALLIRGDMIAAVGNAAAVRAAAGPWYDDLDCGGDAILPAFTDAHLHLLAWATSLRAVDCSPWVVTTIPELLAAIAERARTLPPGEWLRATGYRETELAERRHPTRWEIDDAAPDHPVRLDHGSSHGCVLNSAALQAVGLTIETEEPAGGFISRRVEDGEPDGLLLEMGGWLEGRTPRMAEAALRQGVAEASRRLLAAGVTAAVDMGARNDRTTSATLDRFRAEGVLRVDTVCAVGYEAFARGERPWASNLVKLVVTELGGEVRPSHDELAAAVAAVTAAGCRAALHCVSAPAVAAAVSAFERALQGHSPGRGLHRLEHAAVCPPELARRIAALPVLAVMNPGLIAHDGDRFLRDVPAAELPWLHNARTLIERGAPVAAGSDAPVAPPEPLAGIRAMVERRTLSGSRVPGATTSLAQAVAAHTMMASVSADGLPTRGQIAPRARADLVRLPAGWDREGECGEDLRPRTMLAGRWV